MQITCTHPPGHQTRIAPCTAFCCGCQMKNTPKCGRNSNKGPVCVCFKIFIIITSSSSATSCLTVKVFGDPKTMGTKIRLIAHIVMFTSSEFQRAVNDDWTHWCVRCHTQIHKRIYQMKFKESHTLCHVICFVRRTDALHHAASFFKRKRKC